ncbi:MAG TPA: RNA 2',3'-cyclic phosphodiesterase [Myxococcota bacterium]|nr:RNA 2',3'-cyclic phosphodiesterase [Myxococcota bacterium]
MSDRVRAFLAVALPDEVRSCAVAAVEQLRRAVPGDVRWVPAENHHLTLKFLGEIAEDRVDALVARAGAKLAPLAPFEVALAGFGAFPSAREARVLWLGVARGSAALAKLARKLDSAARVAGAERERRPFSAHLTLGRLREPARVEIEKLAPPTSVPWTVAEVVLYESRLAPDGARHVPLAHLPLGAGLDPSENEFAPES